MSLRLFGVDVIDHWLKKSFIYEVRENMQCEYADANKGTTGVTELKRKDGKTDKVLGKISYIYGAASKIIMYSVA